MNELKKGSRITLRIDRLSLGGDGVARVGGAVVFVPYGTPGDQLEVELVDVRSHFARGRLLRILETSPVRVDPPCPYHFRTEDSGLRTEQKALRTQSSALRTLD